MQKSACGGDGLASGGEMVMEACHFQTSIAETTSILGRRVKECNRVTIHLEAFKFIIKL